MGVGAAATPEKTAARTVIAKTQRMFAQGRGRDGMVDEKKKKKKENGGG